MKNLDEYIRDLTKRVKINEGALKISEKGAKMEKRAYLGFYLPYMRTQSNDVILGAELDRLRPKSSSTVIVWRITEQGFEMISREDLRFEFKVKRIYEELEDKNIYAYNPERLVPEFIQYWHGKKVVDLREMLRMLSLDIEKDDIPVPWDPITYEEISDVWEDGKEDMVKIHSIADALRIYSIYLIAKVTESVTATMDINVDYVDDTRSDDGKIKLPDFMDY